MKKIIKRYHTPGTAPGTLIQREQEGVAAQILLMVYTAETCSELEIRAIADCEPYRTPGSTLWIHLQGTPSANVLEELGSRFGLHALALEDVQNTGQRPKLDVFDQRYFMVAALPVIADDQVQTHQISIFYGDGFVISIANGGHDPFQPVRRRLHSHSTPMRTFGADHLLYALLDLIIDEAFPVLEQLGEKIDELEEEVLASPSRDDIERLHHIKRSLLILRRILWPQREIINALLREDALPLSDHTRIYLRDCYDHSIQLMELLESYRDMTASILDIYLSSINFRTNDVMRTLTVISTIFLPLTFIVGIYGMNFGNGNTGLSPFAMPELNAYYGYPSVIVVMVALTGIMLRYFKRKDWF
ncbi:MAG: magnesium/cobalt transporter CorA [Porticoccaceae bacterium]